MLSVAESWFDSMSSGWHERQGIFLPEDSCDLCRAFQMAEGCLGQISCFCKRQKSHWNRWNSFFKLKDFHISKQVPSYTVSSFFWFLGIVILPVQFKKLKGHSLVDWAGYCVVSGKGERSYMECILFRELPATESDVMTIKFLILQIFLGQMNSCLSQWIVTKNNEIFFCAGFPI